MASTSTRLRVLLDQGGSAEPLAVGECLWVPSQRAAAFQWSAEALNAGLNLSPFMLPLEPKVHMAPRVPFSGLHPLFADSIPDGFGLRLMDHGLRQAGLDPAEVTPLVRLAWVGERGVGALIYRPVIDSEELILVDVVQAAELAARADEQNFRDIPLEAIRAGGSAMGARPKFWAALGADKVKVILGDTAKVPVGFSPVLLKFAPSRGDANEPYFEAACLELAQAHGVPSARGHLLSHESGAALAVERFDRTPSGGRVHVQSVAALLGIDFREPSLSYESVAKMAGMLGGQAQVERVYRQLCFNVAMHLRDDHAKNFSFCMGAEGDWRLSSAYDLCPSDGIGLTGEHTMTVRSKGKGITAEDLIEFALSVGLSAQTAREGVDQARAASSKFEGLAVSLGATKTGAKVWASKLKGVDAFLKPVAVARLAERPIHHDHSTAPTLAESWGATPGTRTCTGPIKALSNTEVIQSAGRGKHLLWDPRHLQDGNLAVGEIVTIHENGRVDRSAPGKGLGR